MLEHEQYSAISSIASRGQSSLTTVGRTGAHEISKSFLLKRMEIDFIALPDLITDDASATANAPYILCFSNQNNAAQVDTPAEMFDVRLEDKLGHQNMICTRPFVIQPHLIDDADNTSHLGETTIFKTSKSFSKGFRLDKDALYTWSIFNPTGVSLDVIQDAWLKVRYWGVYLE